MMTTLRLYPSVLVAVALLVVLGPQTEGYGQTGSVRRALVDGGIYTFQNVGDRGLLTSITTSAEVVTDDWRRQLPSQKWRATKALVNTIYMFKPMSEESSKIALAVSHSLRDRTNSPMVRKEPYVLGYSNDLYWSVIASLNNYYMLRNEATGLCLESRGAGRPVGVSDCNHNVNQQWAIQAVLAGGNNGIPKGTNNGQFPIQK